MLLDVYLLIRLFVDGRIQWEFFEKSL